MSNNVIPRYIFPAIAIFVCCGCGIKLKGAKKGDGASMETFLVGNGAVQYFVKPLVFTSPKSKIFADFTFRGNQDSLYSAKLNFSTESGTIDKIDSLQLVNDATNQVVATAVNPSASAVKKGRRYFSEVNNGKLYDLFVNGRSFSIVTYTQASHQVFKPSPKSLKKIRKMPSVLMNN